MNWTVSRGVRVVEPKLAQVFECEETWRELVDRWAAFGRDVHAALPMKKGLKDMHCLSWMSALNAKVR